MLDDNIDRALLLRLFLGEAEETLAAMEEALLALEHRPDNADLLNTIFRGAHTLKGNAATLGLDPMVEAAHVAEDLLDELRTSRITVTADLITLLLSCVDTFKVMVAAIAAGPDALPAADPALLDALRNVVATGQYVAAASDYVAAPVSGEMQNDTMRVSLAKLDAMMNLASEIAIARGRMRQIIETMSGPSRDLVETQELLDRLGTALQEQVTGVRLVPVGPVFQQQVRIVRDLARAAGKAVQVHFEGQDVELDNAVIDRIRDPLMHMLRNAVDHGIEDPALRASEGKPRAGTIVLRAFRDSGMVVIQVSDDGAGLDARRIGELGRSAGLLADGDRLSDERMASLIFTPGFSTATRVTAISGRGVGMDVVQRNTAALRGAVSIASTAGQGTTVTIRLPLTLAIIDALSVGVGDQTFIVPLDDVVECLDIAESDLQGGTSGVFEVRGAAVPFVRLAAALGIVASQSARRSLILIRHGERHAGVIVDRLNTRTQAVIKPLCKPLPRMRAISGATILGDGSVALIVDLPRVLREQLEEAV
jgi:two-component system chemotaxis sensor kinase CheA